MIGCVKSALLWYELYTNTLKDIGFELNPYDLCVANKDINGKQCTIVWHVDDNKISHVLFLIFDVQAPTCTTQLFTPPLTPIQPATHHHSLHTSPSMFLGHCVASVHVMSIEMKREVIGSATYARLCWTSELIRRKPLHGATTVRRQRPWTNALGGLYLPCWNRMLGRRWLTVVLRHWGGIRRSDEKVAGGFPHPRVRFSLHGEVALYRISLRASSYRGDNPQSLTLAIYSPNFRRWLVCFFQQI